jgi:type I restriction enzyme R subunit
MTVTLYESDVEEAAIEWFQELGYDFVTGPDIAPGEPAEERAELSEVVLQGRLENAIDRLNPNIPPDARQEALRKVLISDAPTLITSNRSFHEMLREGVEVEYSREDGTIAGDRVRLIDYDNVAANDWLVVNQFTVIEGQTNRRPDVVVFLNGLPLIVIELKNAVDEEATIWTAYNQLQTYITQIPSLFHYNALLVISDGLEARIGSLTANKEWFKPWRTIEGEEAPNTALELEVMVKGAFERERLLKLLQYYIVFESDTDSDDIYKIVAGYHQFHAAENAVRATTAAAGPDGDRRGGVVWHTQGSGKSLSMLFFAGQIIQHPQMQNPTLVLLTDRNDLDDQLFGQFSRCSSVLRQTPVQADSVANLKELLQVASGGVVFTTIQKFMPDEKGGQFPSLSERRNIVVIADEAHRSQYDMIDGLARNMRDALPNACFIGFTGTPIEKDDANTLAVFGPYVSIYDIQQAVADGATVPIYYESRIAKLSLNQDKIPELDGEFEDITEDEEEGRREKLKNKWTAMEALVGDEQRLALIAKDLVTHFENRLEAMDGKAMIVCMSRRICVDLYSQIVKLRPDWHSDDDEEGSIKIVMTGSASDKLDWQPHVRNKPRRKTLARRFKKPNDPFKVVIVRDMWLTGFDVPCLHTMYVDKPMRDHGLMQAIARVNRVFRDKPGGLVVDYLGLGEQLKKAVSTYTNSGGKGKTTLKPADAIAAMLERYEICCDMLHGMDWSAWAGGSSAERLKLLPVAQDLILGQADGKQLFTATVRQLSSAFALCASSDEALKIRDDISFFQHVRAALSKSAGSATARDVDETEFAIRQLISKAITPADEVVDVFTAAGLDKPDISILSDEFLAEVKNLKHKNLAVDLLEKLLKSEIKIRSRKNVVQARSFTELLQQTLIKYHNRSISMLEIIDELLGLAKEIRSATLRGDELGMNDDELAFYDALAMNESAIEAMGIDELKVIAAELVTSIRKSVTIDWTLRESARAAIRVGVRRILRSHGYPPDLSADAVKLVLEQAETLCADWAVAG